MRSDDRPQSERIAADLRAEITAGRLAPGSKLSSIPRLAELHGISTTAIQNALRILKDEGFLISRAGSGVYIRDRHPFVVHTAAYFAPAERGVTYRLLKVAEIDPPSDVAAALGEERAVLRHRLMLRGEEPCELSWSYYPASIAAGTPLAARGKIRGGAPSILADLGLPQREFIDRLSTRPPTTEEAEALELPGGVPVIRQFRIVNTDDQRPVEVSILIKGGHLYELLYRQPISQEQ